MELPKSTVEKDKREILPRAGHIMKRGFPWMCPKGRLRQCSVFLNMTIAKPPFRDGPLPLKIPIKNHGNDKAPCKSHIAKTENCLIPILRHVQEKHLEVIFPAVERNPSVVFSAIDLGNST